MTSLAEFKKSANNFPPVTDRGCCQPHQDGKNNQREHVFLGNQLREVSDGGRNRKENRGTIAVKSRFRKTSPNGLKTTAYFLYIIPRTDPIMMDATRIIENP